MMVTWVRGHFNDVRGRLRFDPAEPRDASVEAVIPTATLSSGEAARDEHLRSADFLDVEHHPPMRFTSDAVELLSTTEWRVDGPLTRRGVTRPVTLQVRFLGQWETPCWEDGVDQGPVERVGFCATTTLNRHDFGVRWTSALPRGGVVVGDLVHVTLDVEALRRK